MICSERIWRPPGAWLFAAACLCALPCPAAAQPVQVVEVCGSDDAPGGLNLATALGAGGPISIRCPAGETEIRFTATRPLAGQIAIAGEGEVTLIGPATGPMFQGTGDLRLSRLTLVSDAATPGAIVSGDAATVALDNVTVRNTRAAFLVRSFRAMASRFADNGNAAAEAPRDAVINAETVELADSEFTGNHDHPIAGGAWPAPGRVPLSRRVTIDGSTFIGNTVPILLIDAKAMIRASRFNENGRKPATARDAWGCCGGAITMVRSDVEIHGGEFTGNGSFGPGGAILSIASRLAVGDSAFSGNEARIGGAIMSWGRPPRENIWSEDDWTDLPRLALSGVTFRANRATAFGGAIGFSGSVEGTALVFRENAAGVTGGAVASWRAAALPAPHDGAMQALVDNTLTEPPDRMTLARSILTGNEAGSAGAILALSDATAALGNVVLARNTAPGGAALAGTRLRVVNSVIADNAATGVRAPAGGILALGNSAIMRNAANCALAQPAQPLGPNMQHPGSDCGTEARVIDPGLDGSYAPALISAARDAGETGVCVPGLARAGPATSARSSAR